MKNFLIFPPLVMLSSSAFASDFSGLMALMLIPYTLCALGVWVITWFSAKKYKTFWAKVILRSFGLCLIFTPTYTSGGNGKMLSVALYDIVSTVFGSDMVYAKQAIVNTLVSTFVVSTSLILIVHYFENQRD